MTLAEHPDAHIADNRDLMLVQEERLKAAGLEEWLGGHGSGFGWHIEVEVPSRSDEQAAALLTRFSVLSMERGEESYDWFVGLDLHSEDEVTAFIEMFGRPS